MSIKYIEFPIVCTLSIILILSKLDVEHRVATVPKNECQHDYLWSADLQLVWSASPLKCNIQFLAFMRFQRYTTCVCLSLKLIIAIKLRLNFSGTSENCNHGSMVNWLDMKAITQRNIYEAVDLWDHKKQHKTTQNEKRLNTNLYFIN